MLWTLLDRANEEMCAAKWTGHIGKGGSLVDQLKDGEIDEWVQISGAAALAELLEEPPAVTPKPTDGKTVFAALLAHLAPNDAREFSRIFQHPEPLSDERACWVVRILFSRSGDLDSEMKKVAVRWLASL